MEPIVIDGRAYPVQEEQFPLTLTDPFMYGDNTRKLQVYLNKVYQAGLREHGIYGQATDAAVKKHLEVKEIPEERMAIINAYKG